MAINTLFEWPFAQSVRPQCRRSRVQFPSETHHSQMLYEGIFKHLRIPGINSKESIRPAYVDWRASTTTLFLAPIDCSKIPVLSFELHRQKLLAGKQQENSQIFNEYFYLPLYLPLCSMQRMQMAFGRIFTRTLHATASHSATILHRDLGGAVAAQAEIPN